MSGCILPCSTFLCGSAKQWSQIVSFPREGSSTLSNSMGSRQTLPRILPADHLHSLHSSTVHILLIYQWFIIYIAIYPNFSCVSIFAKIDSTEHRGGEFQVDMLLCAPTEPGWLSIGAFRPSKKQPAMTCGCFSPNQRLGSKQHSPFVAELQAIGLVLNSIEAAWTSGVLKPSQTIVGDPTVLVSTIPSFSRWSPSPFRATGVTVDDAVAVELQRPQWKGRNAVHGLLSDQLRGSQQGDLCHKRGYSVWKASKA